MCLCWWCWGLTQSDPLVTNKCNGGRKITEMTSLCWQSRLHQELNDCRSLKLLLQQTETGFMSGNKHTDNNIYIMYVCVCVCCWVKTSSQIHQSGFKPNTVKRNSRTLKWSTLVFHDWCWLLVIQVQSEPGAGSKLVLDLLGTSLLFTSWEFP